MLTNSAFCKMTRLGNLDCLTIAHPKFSANISLQGAQLTQFQATQQPPLLWKSKLAQYQTGKSVRGGIPICWPWFGNLQSNPDIIKQQISQAFGQQELAHGFAREYIWQLEEIIEACHNVTVSLVLIDSVETHKIWPYKFKLRCVFILSDIIEMQLISSNTGQSAFSYSEALHTYLPAFPIQDHYIQTANQPIFIDTLDDWQEKKQIGHITINEEVDRIYRKQQGFRLISPASIIEVASNSQDSVIWNPWIDKSKRLSQFSNDDYQEMVCIENANVLDNFITLLPGHSHSLTLRLHLYSRARSLT